MQNFFKDKLSHPNTLDDLKYSCGRKENTFSFNISVIKTQTRTSKDERRMKEVTHWKDNDQLTGPTDDENEQSKQNRSNRIFLLLWPLKQTRRWIMKRYCRSQVQVSCFEWVSPFMAYEVFLCEYEILLTRDLGTFPLVVTFWLCFSLATRIRCLAGIFEDFLIVIKLLQDQVQPNHNKAKLKRKRRNESHSMWRKTFPTRCLIGADSSRDTKGE